MLRRCADFCEDEPWPTPGSFKDAGRPWEGVHTEVTEKGKATEDH